MSSSLHMSSLSAMGISWFTPAGWRELQAVAEDELADTYEAFVRQTEKSIKEYEAQGYAVTKVLIDVPHMTAWFSVMVSALTARLVRLTERCCLQRMEIVRVGL